MSSGQKPRTPEHFPHMHERGRARRRRIVRAWRQKYPDLNYDNVWHQFRAAARQAAENVQAFIDSFRRAFATPSFQELTRHAVQMQQQNGTWKSADAADPDTVRGASAGLVILDETSHYTEGATR